MTETRLRTWTHVTGYTLAAVFIAALALQNLRYGFYTLFYLALAMTTLLGAGLVYTIICRRHQLSAPGHLLILALLNGGLAATAVTVETPGISHWAMPLLVLNLLILPLRRGVALSLALLIPVIIMAWLNHPVVEALNISGGLLLLLAITASYVWHYDHMAQSAKDLALTDPVTGAHNPRFLDETLQQEISRASATGYPLSVISLDLDHAEEIRALHGTRGLQTLLRNMTGQLFEIIRAGDSLYSSDGTAFFLILPFTPEEGARVIAERIRRIISEQDWPEVGKIAVSLGCTTRVNEDTSAEQLRVRAVEAMTEARRRGADSAWFVSGESVNA
jgi:diguanylate cyclase (GGDEF)-like protein